MITDVSELYELDDTAFNRAMAEIDHWTVEPDSDNVPEREQWWYLLRDGEQVGYVPATNAPEAWGVAADQGLIPDYANDLNAAWALCGDLNRKLMLDSHDNTKPGGLIETGQYPDQDYFFYEQFHAQPARALATAWAAWKLAQGVGA